MALDLIKVYKEQEYDKAVQWHKDAELLRKRFVEKYPIEAVKELSLQDYTDFCHRIKQELRGMASMGNARPDVFGIYLKGGVSPTLSKTYANSYENDYEAAFIAIKDDICELVNAAENDDYDAIDDSRLNSIFKFKLIITYLPGKIVPVVTSTALEQYCIRVGVPYDAKRKMIYQNIMLRDWKASVPEIAPWSNEVLMSFCDWLWRTDKKIDGSILKREYNTAQAKKISEEIDTLGLKGTDREAVVKSRVNQGVFKERLLSRYNHCCLCNVSNKDFLIASHIKPWKDSAEDERLEADNGFLLCPGHDKAFDKGYISFDDDGKIIISDELDDTNRLFLNLRSDMSIELTDGNREYLKFHREYIFKA